MIYLHCEQGSDEWLQARAGVITASRFKDARAKLERAYKGRQAGEPHGDSIRYAWLIALERIAGIPLDETFVTWRMRRGQELEPRARELYEVRTGALVDEAGIVFTDDRLFGYSTDGLVDDDGCIEVKCPATPETIGLTWTDPTEVVKEYIDQVLGGLWITGRKWCDLVIYTPWLESIGKDLFVQRIHRDDDLIEALETDLVAFARRVQAHEKLLRQPIGAAGIPPWEPPAAPAPAPAPKKPAAKPAPAVFELPNF